MQLHWCWFNTIAIAHCENNENEINTQIIANGLSLSLRLHLASINRFPLQQLLSLLPTTATKKFDRFGRAWKTWNAAVICSCTPPAPPCTDGRQGMFHFTPLMLSAICLTFHICRRLSASRGKQPRQIFSPLFPLELQWWWAALPHCIFSFFGLLECQAWSCGK